jgi:DNA-binding transcriptional LysR family regulator
VDISVRHPGILDVLRMERAQDAAALALVEMGAVDIALVVDDPDAHYRPSPGLHSAVIPETPLWVEVGNDHPLAERDIVRLAELDHEQWLIPSGGTLRTIIGAVCRTRGDHPAGPAVR